jgi:hypothetical protein
MTRLYQFTVRAVVILFWLFLAYVVINWAGQQFEFAHAMGGLF